MQSFDSQTLTENFDSESTKIKVLDVKVSPKKEQQDGGKMNEPSIPTGLTEGEAEDVNSQNKDVSELHGTNQTAQNS